MLEFGARRIRKERVHGKNHEALARNISPAFSSYRNKKGLNDSAESN